MNKFERFTCELKQILLDIWDGNIPPSQMSGFFSSLASWLWDGTFFLDITADNETVSVEMGVVKR